MIENYREVGKFVILIIITSIFYCCGNNSIKTSGDMLPTESFKTFSGKVQFDTISSSLSTYKIIEGNKNVFIYERTGTTTIDVNDWEAKYTETLIFQIDTLQTEFNYCDSTLKFINCKYFWICLSKEFKKEIKNIDNGCIKGKIKGKIINIEIDINPDFYFGNYQESKKERKIKYNTASR